MVKWQLLAIVAATCSWRSAIAAVAVVIAVIAVVSFLLISIFWAILCMTVSVNSDGARIDRQTQYGSLQYIGTFITWLSGPCLL